MTPAEADTFADAAAAYVHVPFCSAVCPYCDFAVVAGQDDMTRRYIDAVKMEIVSSQPWRALEAVYFGGGTPSHVAPEMLGEVLETLNGVHGLSSQAEISLEANPEDFRTDNAARLFSIGFNRVSFGAQSFDADVLASLGRRHDSGHIHASIESARRAGFDNISIDLIYGTPGESQVSWKESLANTTDLEPDHVSCYALTVEPGTRLAQSVRDGAEAPVADTQADRYEMAGDVLGAAGYTHYEVSNWCRPGKECRYNLTVWAQGEYVAYGNGAHRFRSGERSRNIRRLEAYVGAVEREGSAVSGSEAIEGWDGELDRLFVGLRRRVGVRAGSGGDALLQTEAGDRLLHAGVLGLRDHRLVVINPLLSDEVDRAVLAMDEPENWK